MAQGIRSRTGASKTNTTSVDLDLTGLFGEPAPKVKPAGTFCTSDVVEMYGMGHTTARTKIRKGVKDGTMEHVCTINQVPYYREVK